MTGPSILDDTGNGHERLETELLAQDRDAARVSTVDVDEATARQLVSDLVDDGLVRAVVEQRVLVTNQDPRDTADAIEPRTARPSSWSRRSR
ncbi:hypothetical protein [Halogeometricum pallidum]|uniref:hypothetical protein n=1 Tax=Halogeometricum pallidum TaxID=411361 RepID=UPI000A00A310